MANHYWSRLKTPVTLVVLLGLLFFAYKWGMAKVTAPPGPKYVKPCIPTPINNGQLDASQITVRIHNGSKMRGKAADVAQQLKTAGFKVTKVGNAEQKSPTTQIIGASPTAPEVQLVAGWFTKAQPVADPSRAIDHSVEVLIGNDYDGMQKQAPTTITVPESTLCLPEPPTSLD